MKKPVVYDCLPEVMASCLAKNVIECEGHFCKRRSICGAANRKALEERAREEAAWYGVGIPTDDTGDAPGPE